MEAPLGEKQRSPGEGKSSVDWRIPKSRTQLHRSKAVITDPELFRPVPGNNKALIC